MGKSRSSEAERRRRAAARAGASPRPQVAPAPVFVHQVLEDEDYPEAVSSAHYLATVAADLVDLEARRLVLLRERDAAVLAMRRDGSPWDDVAAAAGVTRVALLRRLSREGLLERAHPPEPVPQFDA